MKVSGLARSKSKSGYGLSDEAVRALQSGDVAALMESHRGRWNLRMMADDDGDDDSDDDKDDTDDSGDGDDDDDTSGDDDDKDDKGDDDKVTKADLDKALKRMKAADQRATKAEKALKDIEDGKKDDLTKANDKVAEQEAEITELRGLLQSERLNNAFLAANKHTWHKPGSALKLAQSEGYLEDVVSDDGTVDEKALGAALTKLAKDHEYLVKPREGAGASGESTGGGSKNNKDDKATKEADRRRAPALSRRR